MAWGDKRGIRHHLDDHFTIPDSQHLESVDGAMMLNLTLLLKERFQRFQLVYHLRLLHHFEHIMLGGFHIEEEIYGPHYYYPGVPTIGVREYEAEMPPDTILVHLTTRADAIRARMQSNPHGHTLILKMPTSRCCLTSSARSIANLGSSRSSRSIPRI